MTPIPEISNEEDDRPIPDGPLECDVCGDYAEVPFTSCKFCGDQLSFHHGSCCRQNHYADKYPIPLPPSNHREEPPMGRQVESSGVQDQEMFGKRKTLHEEALMTSLVQQLRGRTVERPIPPIQMVAKHDEGAESDDSSVTLTNGRK